MVRKKSLLLVGLFFLGGICFGSHSYADGGQYDSDAGVGFYGKYDTDKSPSQTAGSIPDIEVSETKIPSISDPPLQKPEGRLPSLGNSDSFNKSAISLGTVLIVLTTIIYYKKEI